MALDVSPYRSQVIAALAAVSLRKGPRYAWYGRIDRSVPPAILEWLTMAERRAHLVEALAEELYASFYTQGEPTPSRRSEQTPTAADRQLLHALTEANTGQGRWEPGWTVLREDGSEVVLQGPRLRVVAPRPDFRPELGLRVAKHLPNRSPGFYTALGDAGSDPEVRVYWNVGPAHAPRLMRAVTQRLNRAGIPFTFKVTDHRARFGRRDAAVLYLPGSALGELTGIDVPLRPGVPALTLPLAAGIGAAEHPADGLSFGLTRCRILAAGAVRALEERARDRIAVVESVFAEHGVAIDAPYREPTRQEHFF